jgi:ectoine hydroxylase-related dioxygenase (phytanoyl-CoA dioxygenase family)
MSLDTIRSLAHSPELISMAGEVVGQSAIPIRAPLFDKSPVSNWLVVWHQDTAVPIRNRREKPGWGPWSVKDGITYAHAPASVLREVVALRVHLDDSRHENGPLRVLPATHELGVLSDDQIHNLSEQITAVDCEVPLGGVLAMRPLLVHASSKSKSDQPRRVLHIEYAGTLSIDGMELAVA